MREAPSHWRSATTLLTDIVKVAGWQFGLMVVLSLVTACLEGLALVMLPALFEIGSGGMHDRFLTTIAGSFGLGGLLALYVVLTAIASGAVYLRAIGTARLVQHYGAALRIRLHRAVLSAAWGTGELTRPADLLHALTTEVNQCANAVQIMLNIASRLMYLPPVLAAAFILSPGFTSGLIAVALLASVPLMRLNRRAHRLAGASAVAARALTGEIAEDLSGLRTLKILGAEGSRSAALDRSLARLRDVQLAQTRASAGVSGVQRVLMATAAAIGGWIGLAVLRLEPGALAAIVLSFARLLSSVGRVGEFWRQLVRQLAVHEQLFDRLWACERVSEPAPAANSPTLRREIRLVNVGYSHAGQAAPTLSHIDLVIPALSTTAVVGPSGAGKSTLIDLIMGLIAPTSGSLMIDGIELDAATRVAWRAKVAYVPQDCFLFHDTIRANLILAAPRADEATLTRALHRAAAQFVFALPKGLDTIVGDRGLRLSGGERQRIALARAFIRTPELIVLDEATNALDPATEADVINYLAEIAGTVTVLIVAHHAATIATADKCVRLEAGRIAQAQPDGQTRTASSLA